MNTRHQPALLGGVFIGVLSGLPFVQFGNCCCCLWVVLGGMLVAYLEQERQPGPLDVGAVVRAGLLAGVIGAVIAFVLTSVFGVVLKQFFGPDQQRQLIEQIASFLPPEARDQILNAQNAQSDQSLARMVVERAFNLLASILMYGLFAMLGALLGSAVFKKKTPPVAPPISTIDV